MLGTKSAIFAIAMLARILLSWRSFCRKNAHIFPTKKYNEKRLTMLVYTYTIPLDVTDGMSQQTYKKTQKQMTKKQSDQPAKPVKPASPKVSPKNQAAKSWREKNPDHVRNYKQAYRQRQKATSQNKVATIQSLNEMIYQMSGTLNMQMLGVGCGIRDILEAIDRMEVVMHQLQNGAAIKPKTASCGKMFSKQ